MTIGRDDGNPPVPAARRFERARELIERRPLRMLIAGGLNTAFGLAIFPLLVWSSPALHRHYMIALLIAQATGLCFAFTTYKLGVFKARDWTNIVREFGAFASFYLVTYALNWAALPVLVEALHVSPVIAQFGFAAIIISTSYFWHSRVTFARALRRG